MHKPLRLPMTNVYGKGDYSAVVHIGSEQSPVNLLLDTGSSTLVVKTDSYQPEQDKKFIATPIAQEVNYGIGGWNGPVVNTCITLSEYKLSSANDIGSNNICLSNVPLALVSSTEQEKTFADADGFLGLAYHHLNKGFNLTGYFSKNNISPAVTYPWPFFTTEGSTTESSTADGSAPNSNDLKAFKKFLWQYPEHDITPYFTELEQHKLTANKFAFYSKRSSVYINEQHADINAATASKNQLESLAQLPQNQGYLVIGGGEEQTDLYQGDFESVKVEHDVYYNVELNSVQVGDKPSIKAAPLQQSKLKSYFTNAIIDTGAGGIVLTAALYSQVIADLIATNANFEPLLTPFKDFNEQLTGIDASLINLSEWPTIYFNFIGEVKSEVESKAVNTREAPVIKLACTPETYWQLNTPAFAKTSFKLLSQLPQWPNQSIIGLPLLNNYYVVFDRSEDKTGVVKFALQK